mmetsp:Transcript_6831/g.9001  ORF Transcript_6831/g.9001 Transcript_6831/m.9001 type:complete len:748 (+) Transcript_6831:2-2245(+)
MAVVLEGAILYEAGQALDGSDSHWIWKGSWRFQGRNAKSNFQYKHLRQEEVEEENKTKSSDDITQELEEAIIKEALDTLIAQLEKKAKDEAYVTTESESKNDHFDPKDQEKQKDTVDKKPSKEGEGEDKANTRPSSPKPPPIQIPETVPVLDPAAAPPAAEAKPAAGSSPVAPASGNTTPSLQPKSKPPFLHLMGGLKRSAPPDLEEMAGTWQGHFNLTDVKTGASSDITETFEIEFAPMPPEELDAHGHKRRGARKKIERGDVRVTGSGGNQFGVFTLKGSYDGNTQFLALEKHYQSTPVPKQEKKRTKKRSTSYTSPLGSPVGQPKTEGDSSLGFGVEVDEELGLVRKSKRQRSSTAPAFLYDFISDSVHFRPDTSADRSSKKKERAEKKEDRVEDETPKSTKRDRKKSVAEQDGGGAKAGVPSGTGAGAGVSTHFITSPPPSSGSSGATRKVGRPKGGSKLANKEKLAQGVAAAAWTPAVSKKKRHTGEHPNWRSAYIVNEETGEIYEGGWLHGKRHYVGVCVYPNGNMYEGEWKHGLEHGKGKLMTPERGIIFEGYFQEGKISGRGLYYFPKGDRYDGEWKENQRHGRGVYETSSGAKYDGEWRDGMRYGKGIFTWPDGSTYDGEWANDMRHGKGELKLVNGFQYNGQWSEDMMEGRGECEYVDGQRYQGTFREGKKDGRGTLIFKNKATYEGRFKDDRMDGTGTLKILEPVEDVNEGDYMIPVQLADIERIHMKAGFDKEGQ